MIRKRRNARASSRGKPVAAAFALVAALRVAAAAAEPAPAPGVEPLPFLPAQHAGDRFAVSQLTKTYEEPLIAFVSQASSRSPRTIEWLDAQARIAAAAAATARSDSSNVQLATGGTGDAASIPPEEKKALDPPKPPIAVGIPSPVAIAGSLAGGLVLLVKLIAALSR